MQRMQCVLLVVLLGFAACGQPNEAAEPIAPASDIAFASFAPLNTDIFVANGDGSDPKPLLADPALDYNASFSPDGQWIVFTSERNGSADIYRVQPDGTGLERLTDDPAFDDQGVLSPDGRLLAFVSSRGGQADIWVLDLTTRAHRQITNRTGFPSWSPDARQIVYRRSMEGRNALLVVDVATRAVRELTSGLASVNSPVWSPRGDWIAFTGKRDGDEDYDIYMIRSDGTDLQRLTDMDPDGPNRRER